MRRRCRIHRCASLAGGGLSAARTVAFARGEAIIVERCMRHDSRQRVRELLWLSVESKLVALATIATPSRADAPGRRPVAAVRHATAAAEAPAAHWAGRQKARAALASATRASCRRATVPRSRLLMSDVEFVAEISRCRAPLHRSTTQAVRPAADVELYSATCLLYTSPSPRDRTRSRMPSSA